MFFLTSFTRYQVMNYRRFKNGSYGYVQIATWDQGTLEVSDNIQWKDYGDKPPVSVCSQECPKGSAKVSSLKETFFLRQKGFLFTFVRYKDVFPVVQQSSRR